jgi:adsorption protein A
MQQSERKNMHSRCQAFLSRFCTSSACVWLLFLSGADHAFCSDNVSEGVLGYIDQLGVLNRRPWLDLRIQKFVTFPRLDRAYRLINEGKISEAKKELTELLEQNPNDLTASVVLLVIEENEHDHRQVIERATGILSKYPSFAPALLYRGLSFQSLGKNEKAYQDIKLLLEQKEVQQADLLLALDTYINLALSEKHFQQAADAAERLAQYRSDFRLWYRRAVALQSLGQFEDAERFLLRALDSNPDTTQEIQAWQLIGQMRLNQSDWPGAVGAFETALQLQPKSPDLLRWGAYAAYQQHDYRRAQTLYERLVAISRLPSDRMLLARTLTARQEFEAAEQQFRLVTENNAEPAIRLEAYRRLAESARRRNDNKEAARWLKALLSIQEDVPARFEMASLLELRSDFPAMIRDLESIVAEGNSSDRFRAEMKLGSVYQSLKQLDSAERAFLKANRENTSSDALQALAQIADQKNRPDVATSYIWQAIRLSPNIALWAQLATYQERVGQVSESLKSLHEALEQASTNQERKPLYVRQAFLLDRLGQKEEARRIFALASATDPSDAAIHLAHAQLELDSGHEEDAIAELGTIPTATSVRAATLLGAAYEKRGRIAEAIQAYRQALQSQKHPSDEAADIALRIAFLESRGGNHAAAAEALLESFTEGSEKSPERLFEAGNESFAEKQWEKAAQAFAIYVADGRLTQAQQARAWESLGYAFQELQVPQKSADAFDRALRCGNTKEQVHKSLAFALYNSGDWKRALAEFQALTATKGDTDALLGVAHSYEHLDKPGLATHYLERALAESSNVSQPSRMETLRELSNLYTSMSEHRMAARALQTLEKVDKSNETKIRLASALRASGEDHAAEIALSAVDLSGLTRNERIWYLDEKASILENRGEYDLSLAALREANTVESKGWRYYKAALIATKLGRKAEAVALLKDAVNAGSTGLQARAALAYALEANGQLEDAAVLFDTLSSSDPSNPQWSSAAGYANLKLANNAASVQWFRKSIDLLENSVPDPAGSSGKAGLENEQVIGLRSEVAQLSRTFDFTLYQGFASNSYSGEYDFGSFTSNPFPNTTGIEFSYTPPGIGRRNGRELQAFTRLLWSDPEVPLQFNRQYYQLSAGVRYKPVPKQNLWVSAERMIHSADPYTGGWLLRGLYSWTPGSEMKINRRKWNYSVLFSDTSFVPNAFHLFAEYAEVRKGLAFNVHNALTITPFAVADGRWQSIPSLIQGYTEIGGGVSLRYFFRQNKYEWYRSTWELVFQCKRGTVAGGAQSTSAYAGCSATSILHF